MRWVRLAAAIAIVAAAVACTKTVDGRAIAPPGTDPDAEIVLTDDGFGIQIGEPFAPAAIEIFTEPQCPECADLQFFYGTALADYIDDGDLVVTYRFLTFLDKGTDGYSHMVSNAMFLAAEPDADVTAEDFQKFVEEVYWDLDTKADDRWLADIADEMGFPTEVVDKIAVGEQAVDVAAMNTENQKGLEQVDRKAQMPTVYDVNAEEVVDLDDYDWLDSVVGSR